MRDFCVHVHAHTAQVEKMIKLFSLKQQSKDGLNPQSSKKTSAAYLRVQKGDVLYCEA